MDMKGSAVIHIEDVRKAYGKKGVLDGVSLAVEKGEIFCLLGSNGAGKTTLVRILATLLKADGGAAHVSGYDVAAQARMVRENIGLTGQYVSVDQVLTVRENLRLVGKLLHLKNYKARADELIRAFGLEEHAMRRVAVLSGGLRRRLDIAMSLTGAPKVLFLDEPTTGLDPQSRMEMWNEIRKLARDGTTVFLTTQYLEEAELLADRIAVLHGGKIVALGTPEELKTSLGGGSVLVAFRDENALKDAAQRLERVKPMVDAASLTVSVPVDGSVEALSALLELIRGLPVAFIEQRRISLEDVFLKLVSEKNGRNDA
jgi:ABC-2 type transport system ATP-binding protein